MFVYYWKTQTIKWNLCADCVYDDVFEIKLMCFLLGKIDVYFGATNCQTDHRGVIKSYSMREESSLALNIHPTIIYFQSNYRVHNSICGTFQFKALMRCSLMSSNRIFYPKSLCKCCHIQLKLCTMHLKMLWIILSNDAQG